MRSPQPNRKTSSCRYPEEPDGLLGLDPQLLCYSWITGISEVAQIVFVRKRSVEIQYFAPPSPTNSDTTSASWFTAPSSESNQRSFCRIAAFVFRKNPATHAGISGCICEEVGWSKPASFAGQEHRTFVCLTSLRTKYPPMSPKLNPKRAVFVLTKIDEILAWERRKEAEKDTRFVELGRHLCEVRAGQYWRVEKLASFDDSLGRRFPESRARRTTLCRYTNTCLQRSSGV